MLQITLPRIRLFNEATEEFVIHEPVTLKLEHSLISLHKWEAKWQKSYLSSKEFTTEEQLDYIRCMSIDSSVTPDILMRLTKNDFKTISDYIHAPMTATTFSKQEEPRKKQIITAEIVYYWMVSFGIPFECSKWHLNQLLTLINVCSIKNSTPKKGKKSSKDIARQNMNLNQLRRAQMGTLG